MRALCGQLRRRCPSLVVLRVSCPVVRAHDVSAGTRRLCPLTASLFSAKSFSVVHAEDKTAHGLEEHEVRDDGKLPEAGEAGKIWGGVDEGGFQSWQGARVPLNGWQQAAVAAGSAVGALINPARADLVAALGETTGSVAFRRILGRMNQSAEGQKVLLNRPRVISTTMAQCWDMPPNTFGGAYAKFMGDRNFSPDDRPPVRFLESEDLAYIATRSREVHDLWHVLFNLPTSVVGELALKMVEFHQTGIPMCFLSVAGASWRLKPQQRNSLFTHYAPWALRAGVSASDLMCIYYEEHFQEDLDEVRRKWGILPAPPQPKKPSY